MENGVAPKSLTELVTQTLRRWIISGRLKQGRHLSEVRLAKELNVSRTPVREAVNRLETEGLVVVIPQRGTFVFSTTEEDLSAIGHVRVALEVSALRAAAVTDLPELIAGMSRCCDALEAELAGGDMTEVMHWDTQFHQLAFDISGNPYLQDSYRAVAGKMAALRNASDLIRGRIEEAAREHRSIIAALSAGDVEEAIARLTCHIWQGGEIADAPVPAVAAMAAREPALLEQVQ